MCSAATIDAVNNWIRAIDPQIVNGAQTTSAVVLSLSALKVNVRQLQARFMSVPSGKALGNLRGEVSRFTNSQNAVKKSDLRANEKRHVTIQSNFSMLTEPLFHERRMGEWGALEA